MFLFLQKYRSSVSAYYFTRDSSLLSLGVENLLPIGTFRNFFLVLRAEYIFVECDFHDVCPSMSYQLGNFYVVNLRHGDPLKHVGILGSQAHKLFRELARPYFNSVMKIACSSSLSSQKNLNEAFLTENFSVTGLPRNDVFFDTNLCYYDVIDTLNL